MFMHLWALKQYLNNGFNKFLSLFSKETCNSLTVLARGGQLFSSAGHIGPLFVSRGPNSSQMGKLKADKLASAGRMWPAGRILPPPGLGSNDWQNSCWTSSENAEVDFFPGNFFIPLLVFFLFSRWRGVYSIQAVFILAILFGTVFPFENVLNLKTKTVVWEFYILAILCGFFLQSNLHTCIQRPPSGP